jgi:hypothetical protein
MPQDEHTSVKLSAILESLFADSTEKTVGTIVDRLEHHGMAVVLVLFAIPSALPIPAAGYSTLLCIPLMLIGLRILSGGTSVWLPKSIRERSIQVDAKGKMYARVMKIVCTLEKFSRPRIVWLVRSSSIRIAIGLLICLLALSMALPIPGTNTLPAGGIFLLGFGLLEDDGLIMGAGFLYSFVALCLTAAIIFALFYFGMEGVESLKEYLYSFVGGR